MREGYTAEQATSFGAAAEEYERTRPSYPDEAVDWVVPEGAKAAADVGAGTGKLSRALLARGLEVAAVEPDEEMRGTLARELPQARALAGSGERLPVADGAVDLVTYGQAWHWVDEAAALAEAARVLRPGGRLACLWNLRDERYGWMLELSRIVEQFGAHSVVDDGFAFGGRFGPTAELELSWSRPITADQVVELIATRSYVLLAPEAERRRLLAEVRELARTHPEVAGRETFAMPYTTRCFRAELAPG